MAQANYPFVNFTEFKSLTSLESRLGHDDAVTPGCPAILIGFGY